MTRAAGWLTLSRSTFVKQSLRICLTYDSPPLRTLKGAATGLAVLRLWFAVDCGLSTVDAFAADDGQWTADEASARPIPQTEVCAYKTLFVNRPCRHR